MTLHRVLRSAQRTLATTLVTVVTAAGLAAVAPSSATAASASSFAMVTTQAVSPSLTTDRYERKVQYWVNVQRNRHNRSKLTLHSCTDSAAERWSSYLARNNEFYHQSMSKLLDRCNAYYAGETLGRGNLTPRRLVYLWMHSSAHRSVMLSRNARRLGIGATPNAYGQWVIAANFMRF